MNESGNDRLLELFDRAVELPADAHAAFIAEYCHDDPEMARRLAALLTHDARASTTLDSITHDVVTDMLREAVPTAMLEGQAIGAYRIERLLGSGGMGRVYLAHRLDGSVEHAVAIKFVRPDRLDDTVLARFSRERRMLASLQHPGICTFIDAGTLADSTPYVVMEYIEGEPLLEYCNRNHLDIRDRLLLLRKVLAAVAHAHSRLIVHRDLKGSNVLVTGQGETKLLDFGIAKTLADSDYALTATSERFLTPINAAPELIHGEPAGIGCDIYALGVLAYELLSGSPPLKFDGLRGAQVEQMILSVPPRPMSLQVASDEAAARTRGLESGQALARQLKGDLDAIVLRCLRKSATDRYTSVAELDEDIARHLDRVPIRARHGDRLYRLGRFVARYRFAVFMSMALLASLLISTLILALQSAELARQRNLAIDERDHAQQVVQVLRDAFQYADPAQTAGDEVSARQILDAARPRLDVLVDDQPHRFAQLADTLSGVELALLADTQAAELAQRGIAAAQADGRDPALLRRLRLTAARALTGLGDLAAADALLEDIRVGDASLQPDWAAARARVDFSRSTDRDKNIALLRDAAASTAHLPPDDELATEVRWQLAQALRLNQNYAEALQVLDDTLTWQRQQLPDDHPRIILTELRRLRVLSLSEPSGGAIAELHRVVQQVLDQYGPNSSMAGLAHNTLATAYRLSGQVDEAIGQMRLAWRAWRQALGEEHASSLRLGINLAVALTEQGVHFDEAISTLRTVLARAEDRLGLDSPMVIYARANLAQTLARQGQWQEAMVLMASEGAARGDKVTSRSNREFQITVLNEILAEAPCDAVARASIEPACTRARALLARLLDVDRR